MQRVNIFLRHLIHEAGFCMQKQTSELIRELGENDAGPEVWVSHLDKIKEPLSSKRRAVRVKTKKWFDRWWMTSSFEGNMKMGKGPLRYNEIVFYYTFMKAHFLSPMPNSQCNPSSPVTPWFDRTFFEFTKFPMTLSRKALYPVQHNWNGQKSGTNNQVSFCR